MLIISANSIISRKLWCRFDEEEFNLFNDVCSTGQLSFISIISRNVEISLMVLKGRDPSSPIRPQTLHDSTLTSLIRPSCQQTLAQANIVKLAPTCGLTSGFFFSWCFALLLSSLLFCVSVLPRRSLPPTPASVAGGEMVMTVMTRRLCGDGLQHGDFEAWI